MKERLQKMLGEMCNERKVKFLSCPPQYAVDNGTMIAWTGILEFTARKGKGTPVEKASIDPYERTDDVVIHYRT